MKAFRSCLVSRHLPYTVLVLLAGAVFLNGCSSGRTMEEPPKIPDSRDMVVTLKDQSRIKVFYAFARGDTLFGRDLKRIGHPTIAIPLEEIASIEAGSVPR